MNSRAETVMGLIGVGTYFKGMQAAFPERENFQLYADTVADAIEWLRPRVVPFKEINQYEVLWMEVRDSDEESGLAPWVKTQSGRWYSPLLCSGPIRDMTLVRKEHYNRIARCWTMRPTDADRQAVEWDE